MGLADDWEKVQRGLPADWAEIQLRFTIAKLDQFPRTSALLAPLQPLRLDSDALKLRVARDGSGAGPEALRRALVRLDSERIGGRIDLVSHAEREAAPEPRPLAGLPSSWDEAVGTLPADWSDLLGEIELASSDYIDRAALHLAPINPRRVGVTMRLQFRSASRFGYGAAPGMVRRCLERCEGDGISGRVEVLRVLSNTEPVGTQGPVWQIDGRMV